MKQNQRRLKWVTYWHTLAIWNPIFLWRTTQTFLILFPLPIMVCVFIFLMISYSLSVIHLLSWLYISELNTGSAGSSSILEIVEIFQLVELKEGEATLLAKALELYPQLRLSCAQRPDRIIAFSYRALVDILVMLATKTPYTITASDKVTLEANLSAASYFGFDKDWIDLVRVKVSGTDKSDVLVAEENISDMEEELKKCDIALEHMKKKRMEAEEKLTMVQNEFDVIDTQLFDLLEHHRKLDMKMAEFRKIIKAKDMPFGI